MNKEELIVELENNYVQVNIDGVRIAYCNSLDKELVKAIYNLQQENKELKELCNKYEKEHNTTFKIWQKDMKKIDKAIDKLDKLNIKLKEILSTGIDIKEISDIEKNLKGEE